MNPSIYKIYVLAWILGLHPFIAAGQQRKNPVINPEQVLSNIVAAASKVNTIESDFLQEKEMTIMAEKLISSGRFYFKKEKKLRWEYIEPFPYLIIIHDDRILVKDEKQVNLINIHSSKVFREINLIITGAIRGTLLEDEKNFTTTLMESTSQWIATLIPKNQKVRETLSEIVIYFNKRDMTVDRLIMRESSGDYTRITFSGKKINMPVDEKVFTLE